MKKLSILFLSFIILLTGSTFALADSQTDFSNVELKTDVENYARVSLTFENETEFCYWKPGDHMEMGGVSDPYTSAYGTLKGFQVALVEIKNSDGTWAWGTNHGTANSHCETYSANETVNFYLYSVEYSKPQWGSLFNTTDWSTGDLTTDDYISLSYNLGQYGGTRWTESTYWESNAPATTTTTLNPYLSADITDTANGMGGIIKENMMSVITSNVRVLLLCGLCSVCAFLVWRIAVSFIWSSTHDGAPLGYSWEEGPTGFECSVQKRDEDYYRDNY